MILYRAILKGVKEMGKIKIYDYQINKSNINSALFLLYIETFGFNQDNYASILELFQSAEGSISQFLDKNRQYLLSRKVEYDKIDKLGINGAYGYLDENGIVVPKTLDNDNRFLYAPVKRLYRPHGYNHPIVNNFDAIIANGFSSCIINAINLPCDTYFGFCMDYYDELLKITTERYKKLVELMNKASSDKYILEYDIANNKKMCLIRKR